MYLHFFNYILNYIHNSYIKKTQELKIIESFLFQTFLGSMSIVGVNPLK